MALCSLGSRLVGCFWFLAFRSNAAVNSGLQDFEWTDLRLDWINTQKWNFWIILNVFLTLLESVANLFFRVAKPFCTPQCVWKLACLSSLTVVIRCFVSFVWAVLGDTKSILKLFLEICHIFLNNDMYHYLCIFASWSVKLCVHFTVLCFIEL